MPHFRANALILYVTCGDALHTAKMAAVGVLMYITTCRRSMHSCSERQQLTLSWMEGTSTSFRHPETIMVHHGFFVLHLYLCCPPDRCGSPLLSVVEPPLA